MNEGVLQHHQGALLRSAARRLLHPAAVLMLVIASNRREIVHGARAAVTQALVLLLRLHNGKCAVRVEAENTGGEVLLDRHLRRRAHNVLLVEVHELGNGGSGRGVLVHVLLMLLVVMVVLLLVDRLTPLTLVRLDGLVGDQPIADIVVYAAELLITVGEHAALLIRAVAVLDVVLAILGLVALREDGDGVVRGSSGLVRSRGGLVMMVVVVVERKRRRGSGAVARRCGVVTGGVAVRLGAPVVTLGSEVVVFNVVVVDSGHFL